MNWSYDLCGAEPIIKDMPVYDAADIAYGELLMLSALSAANYTAGADGTGKALITAYNSTAGGSHAVDAIGISLEALDTDNAVNSSGYASSNPSVAAAHNVTSNAGACFGKVIINPFAVYRAMHDNTGGAHTVAASATVGGLNTTVTNLTAEICNGAFIYHNASAGDAFGSLRTVKSSSATGVMVLNNTTTQSTVGDTCQVIPRKLSYSNLLDASATMLSTSEASGVASATNLRVVENYINNNAGFEILGSKHQNIDIGAGLAGKTRFYSEIMMKDHVFGLVS